MCGIIADIGQNNAIKQSIDSLKKLEYRGYDSSGVAYLEGEKIKIIKSVGNIAKLKQQIKPTNATCVIAHTRWATHGKATKNNAHPHIDFQNCYAVVHNGIIENHQHLKNTMPQTKFYSQTDSEVIPNLIYYSQKEFCLNKKDGF